MSDLVIGTAGHVDHGKTTLVKALTGVDLDRLPEEKARGITIALGFVPLRLPSGRTAGIVDVPGHEKLVRTMVAGASGLDAVLLCVSASEGVMPQTREHLDVLGLLGVRRGVVVLTMADLVDPELRELAAEDVRGVVSGTFLDGAPVLATSATTGTGLPELLAAIDALPSSERSVAGPFRLPVDRTFLRKGFGTVVTGTAWSGSLADGAEVELLPAGGRARVRGIQVHGRAVVEARAGARTALNLSGVEIGDLGRGLWVATPGSVPSRHVIHATYRQLSGAGELAEGDAVVLLHGTREVSGRVTPLGRSSVEAGQSAFVQLQLGEPLPSLPGDRFVLRRPSPAATIGGGEVLDPWAEVVRRKGGEVAAAELVRLRAGDRAVLLERAGAAGLTDAECLTRCGGPMGSRLGDRRYADAVVTSFRTALQEALARHHAAEPLSPGAPRKALHHGRLAALDERSFLAFLEVEGAAGRVALEGGRVRRPDWQVHLAPAEEAWRAAVLASAAAAGFDGLEAAPEIPARDALLFLLRDRGEIELVAGRIYDRGTLDRLVKLVRGWFEAHESLDPAAFKELTGQTRRTAIPMLEWLDANGVTKRRGDVRIRG